MLDPMPATRLLPAPLPFPERDAVNIFSRGRLPVFWLRFPALALAPALVAYRLRLDLTEPLAATHLHVSAGERYRFFLDGVEIGTGPERGDATHWRLDAYALDLAPGTHWLAIEVWSLGALAPRWQVPVPSGLLVATDGPHHARLSTGHAAWESAVIPDVTWCEQPLAFLSGPRARISGASYPWAWTTGGDSARFHPAEVVPHEASGGRLGCEYLPPRLVPASQPRPSLAPLPNGTPVLVDASPQSDPSAPSPRTDPAEHLANEQLAWAAWLDSATPLTLPAGQARRVLIDLGTYRAAWPVLRASGHGSHLRLRFAEALYETDPVTPFDGTPKGDRRVWQHRYARGLGPDFHLAATAQDYRPYEWECGRWLELTAFAGPDAPLVLHRLALHDTSYPFLDEASLASDSPALDSTRALCMHTLRVGTHDHYCDCPYYERLQYLGDTRLEVLATYCLTADDRLPDRALADFAGARLPSGFVPARHPASGGQLIPPFALHWIGLLHEATLWRDSPERTRRLLPVVRGILDAWWARRRATSGLIANIPGWNFVDWVPAWSGGMPAEADTGESAILNWHYVEALRQAAALETFVGEPELAALHRRRADAITTALDATCWDEARGLYLDAPGHSAVSEHAQILPLLAGVAEPRRTRVAHALTTAPDLARATIYFTHYLFEAYHLIGRGDLLWQRLQIWFDLPARGLTTTPEQPEPTRSDCHPWGAHPLYHIVATLAGLRPAAPGFSALTLSPLTDIPLCQLELTIPHPRGKIHLELTRPASSAPWSGHLTVPAGVTATLPPGVLPR